MPRGYCVHAWSHQISGGMSIILYFLLLLSRDNVMERTKQIQLFCIFFLLCWICKSFSATHPLVFKIVNLINIISY